MNEKRKPKIYHLLLVCFLLNILPIGNLHAQCFIGDVIVEAHPCNDLGKFLVDIDFSHANISGSFKVLGNGLNYGTFPYSDLFITLGPFEGNGSVYEFIIQDLEHPDCSAAVTLVSENCVSNDCNIFDLSVETGDCNPNGNYKVWINFEHQNSSNEFFDVFGANGQLIGSFPINQLPVMITYIPSGNNFDFLQVCINDNPNCCKAIEFEAPNCNTNNCEIWDIVAEAHPCNDLGKFLVDIDFSHTNTSGSFKVLGNGLNYGTFPYSDLFITLGPFEGNGSVYEFIIQDLEHPDCGGAATIVSENCVGNDCNIFDLSVETGDCNPNGNYKVWINFEHQNSSNEFFDVFGANGQLIGSFPINQLPVMITYIPSGNNFDFLQVCINDNPNCCKAIEFEAPNCNTNNCEIWDIVAEAHPCNDLGKFLVDIDFSHANSSGSFTVVGNGHNYGTFAYSDLFITLGPFEGNGSVYEFLIQDQAQPDCGGVVYLESVNCTGCHIWDVVAEPLQCNDQGLFSVDIDFNHANTSDSFTVVGNGQNYGTFAYNDLYLTLGPFEGNGSVYEFLIRDQAQPDCGGVVHIESENCLGVDCDIFDFVVDIGDCNPNGSFNLWINFEYQNPGNEFFDVIGSNGDIIGFFPLNELPIMITYEPNNNNFDFLQVCINDNPNCCAIIEFETPNCNNTDCAITDINAYPLTCNPDGTYSLLVLFDYQNVQTDQFNVYANGVFVDSYIYNEQPLIISAFPGGGGDVDAITICDSGSDLCCASAEFEAPNCSSCEIFAVIATPSPCDNNDQFMVDLDFEHNGTAALGFTVFGDGNSYGTFDYSALPISLGPFAGDGSSTYEFIIVDLVNINCIGFTEVEPVFCGVPPPVWPGDINSDNISNNFDLLNLGVAFGESGAPRDQTNTDWLSWEGADWPLFFVDGVNKKHADCNGDGIVNEGDLIAIDLNYKETHGTVLPFEPIQVSPDDPPFYIDLPGLDGIAIGQAFAAPIILGTLETPVASIYGIAFTVEYDPEMMDEAGVYIETNNSWLGEQGSELINVNKNFADQGIIEVAITRIDHNNINGFGIVSYFIGIIDDIAGKTEMKINITNVKAITYEEVQIPLYASSSVLDFTATGISKTLDLAVTIFPNPANETVNIVSETNEPLQNIAVYNMLGQQVTQVIISEKWHQLDVSSWNAGIYFVDLQFASGQVRKKINISR